AVGQHLPKLSVLRVGSSDNAGTSDHPLVPQLSLDKAPRTIRCKPGSTACVWRVLSGASESSIATASRNVMRASDASAAVATLYRLTTRSRCQPTLSESAAASLRATQRLSL